MERKAQLNLKGEMDKRRVSRGCECAKKRRESKDEWREVISWRWQWERFERHEGGVNMRSYDHEGAWRGGYDPRM